MWEQRWLGSGIISFIWDGEEADRPRLSWEWAVFIRKEELEEKSCNHGRNFQALLSILIVLAFLLPGLSLPRGQIHMKIATRSDIIVEVVVDGKFYMST